MASGTRNVEWDAVELPSQFMENWCYQPEIMRSLTRHVDTGEPLPDELIERIRAARNFRAGSGMLRQLYFGLLDMRCTTSSTRPARTGRAIGPRPLRGPARARPDHQPPGALRGRPLPVRLRPHLRRRLRRRLLQLQVGRGPERRRLRRLRGGRPRRRAGPAPDRPPLPPDRPGLRRRPRPHARLRGLPRTRPLYRAAAAAQRPGVEGTAAAEELQEGREPGASQAPGSLPSCSPRLARQ